MKKIIGMAIAALAVVAIIMSGDIAHASTGGPPMGYNTWYQFDSGINETNVLQQAGELVSSGLAGDGYSTVTLDDGWQGTSSATRTSTQPLTWNPQSFPHGIPWLAAQLKSMGLNLGIYTAIGKNTCTDSGHLAGSYGHYAQDAATFASWGVTFVKVDSCKGLPAGTSDAQLTSDFSQFGGYITSRGMTYSEELPVLLPVGSAQYFAAIAASSQFANMWRVAPDENFTQSPSFTILGHLADDLPLHGYARPGHWNDLDMLVPGVPAAHPFDWSLSSEESQLSVWAQEASPLILSTNIGSLNAAELAALKNPDMIAIDQSGSQAPVSVSSGNILAVIKGADGGYSVLLANTGSFAQHASFTLPALHVKYTHARDLNVWTRSTGGLTGVSVTLSPGQTYLLVLTNG